MRASEQRGNSGGRAMSLSRGHRSRGRVFRSIVHRDAAPQTEWRDRGAKPFLFSSQRSRHKRSKQRNRRGRKSRKQATAGRPWYARAHDEPTSDDHR